MKFPLPMLLLTLGLPAATPEAYGAIGFLPALVADGPLTGKVLDENGAGLPGVTVRVKGTAAGTATDNQGNFTLAAVPTDATLLISYVGYKQQEVKANRTGSVTVRLQPTQGQLNEVVVVGYGTQQRKNLIGAIAKVDPSDTKELPVGSFDAQLQGKVSGVQISSSTGVPGEAVNVRVRGATTINGSNNPLYVVDGVFINNNSLQTISTGGKATSPIADIKPSDIESIEVLKDADATALYGARGLTG
jgi:TonB-dependent SusC/RagA subfamily outer membrane receptor